VADANITAPARARREERPSTPTPSTPSSRPSSSPAPSQQSLLVLRYHGLSILSHVARASREYYPALDGLGSPFFQGVYRMLGGWGGAHGCVAGWMCTTSYHHDRGFSLLL
jgi:hypothetical protein